MAEAHSADGGGGGGEYSGRRSSAAVAGLVGAIAAFVFLGIPLLAYVWELLNDLLAGHWRPRRALFGLPAALLLVILWRLLSRAVARWDERPHTGAPAERQP